ncbi:MAG: hypothetical protein HY791_14910 [Deltaproteobacteria bacterium]|nr:hypothetical protein [Deltaproteobacteria bacterium]
MLLLTLSLLTAPSDPAALRAAWNDGKAELAGYDLEQPRYGELRRGRAVLIFVKEPFSESMRVKADPGRHPDADVFDVMKLNFVKHFQTGIYDYDLMTSVFSAMDARNGRRPSSPSKIVFSAQEWCGSVFEQLLFDEQRIRQTRFSYFDGEGQEASTIPYAEPAVSVDELPILVRQIGGPFLTRGQSRNVSVLPSLERARLLHRPIQVQKGTIERSDQTKSISVPAGSFNVETWKITAGDDRYEYDVELEAPFRLIEIRGPDGERARLRGVDRLPYWELNREGHERWLEKLGFPAEKTD